MAALNPFTILPKPHRSTVTANEITPALTYGLLGDGEYRTLQFTCKWRDKYLELAEPAPELTAEPQLGGGGGGWGE